MNSTQVKLVQESFAKVVPMSERAAVLFHDRLFEIAPAVACGTLSGYMISEAYGSAQAAE